MRLTYNKKEADTWGSMKSLLGRDQSIMLLLYPCIMLGLLKFTYHAQYYAQQQESLSDYYAFICNFA